MSRFWLLLLLIGLTACTALPGAPPRPESHALADTHDTVLARSVAPLLQAHPGHDSFILLDDGLDAFDRYWNNHRSWRARTIGLLM